MIITFGGVSATTWANDKKQNEMNGTVNLVMSGFSIKTVIGAAGKLERMPEHQRYGELPNSAKKNQRVVIAIRLARW